MRGAIFRADIAQVLFSLRSTTDQQWRVNEDDEDEDDDDNNNETGRRTGK